MGKRQHLSQSLNRVMADHEILSHYVEHFNEMFADGSARNLREEIAAIKQILNEKVPAHFAFEEEHIFPGLLAAIPSRETSDAVSILREEHALLRERAEQLNQMLSDENPDGNLSDTLRHALLDFLANLERHAAKENVLFPSLM